MRGLGSIATRKKRHPFRWLLFILLVWAAAGGWCWYKARQALTAQPPRATEARNWGTWSARILFPIRGRLQELVNIADLLAGQPITFKDTTTWSESDYAPVLNGLLDRHELDTYDRVLTYLIARRAAVPRFRALYDFDHGRFEAARSKLADQAAFREIYGSGQVPIYTGVLAYDWRDKRMVPLLPGSAWMTDHVQKGHHFLQQWQSTLDGRIQRILYEALGRKNGAFLLARNGRLLAAAAKGMDPLTDRFEAGSVIKVVTMAAALSEGVSVHFPYRCNGPIRVEGRLFYDWAAHGILKNYADSLACSCNLVFAETALALGPEAVDRWLTRFRVNVHFRVPVGPWEVFPAQRKPMSGDYALARGAIGLDAPAITPYWLIMTADLLGHNGTARYPTPFASRTVIGFASRPVPVTTGESIIPPSIATRVREGMHRAVAWKRGTGHRVHVPGMDLWLKTGTAGRSPYNAILMGGFTIDGQAYTFGLFVEKGGKAELGGARVLQAALSRLVVLLKTQPGPTPEGTR